MILFPFRFKNRIFETEQPAAVSIELPEGCQPERAVLYPKEAAVTAVVSFLVLF